MWEKMGSGGGDRSKAFDESTDMDNAYSIQTLDQNVWKLEM